MNDDDAGFGEAFLRGRNGRHQNAIWTVLETVPLFIGREVHERTIDSAGCGVTASHLLNVNPMIVDLQVQAEHRAVEFGGPVEVARGHHRGHESFDVVRHPDGLPEGDSLRTCSRERVSS